MFNEIYPRGISDGPRSVIALMEELGELGEAVRVADVHPQYFLGEAADTFSYLMGIATEHQLREERDERTFSLEREVFSSLSRVMHAMRIADVHLSSYSFRYHWPAG